MDLQNQESDSLSITIPFSYSYYEKLNGLVHPVDQLVQKGYKMENFNEEEILGFRRCRNCHARMRIRKRPPREKKEKKEGGDDVKSSEKAPIEIEHRKLDAKNDISDAEDGGVQLTITALTIGSDEKVTEESKKEKKEDKEEEKERKDDKEKEKEKKKKTGCHFHTGAVFQKHFTCCQAHVSEPGCVEREKHVAIEYPVGELEHAWALHETPMNKGSRRTAVSLDCEMGTSISGESELIRVSVIDYFTRETLLDRLVYPSVPMQHFNTRYSGVTRSMMERARRRNECIAGRDRARQHVWRYVGPNTVVVMHGGQSDLLALRWIHRRVIDTFLVEGSRKKPIQGRSLKHLTEVIMGAQIQQGKKGHDSVEDAMACRALAHWYVENLDGSDNSMAK